MGTSSKFASYGITIEGDAQYLFATELTLGRIESSFTGRVLLSGIKNTGKPIRIIPWDDDTRCNATASPTDYRAATPSNQYILKGGNSFQPAGEPSLFRSLLNLPLDPAKGSGTGSGAVVRFTPGMFGFGAKGACSQYAGMAGASPSQVLFHELAHAYRAARGAFYPRPTIGTSTGYDNIEEFFAIVLSNVLTTDPTFSTANRTLRADHHGFQALPPSQSTSAGFVANMPNRNKMRELILSEPSLVQQLQGCKSTFNPFTQPLP